MDINLIGMVNRIDKFGNMIVYAPNDVPKLMNCAATLHVEGATPIYRNTVKVKTRSAVMYAVDGSLCGEPANLIGTFIEARVRIKKYAFNDKIGWTVEAHEIYAR